MKTRLPRAPEPAPFAGCGEFAQFVRANPFSVLELQPQASRAEAERAATRWLALLEIGNDKAASYPTPFGPMPRSPEAVRAALAQVRDPAARVADECWALALAAIDWDHAPAVTPAWPGATAALAWLPADTKE